MFLSLEFPGGDKSISLFARNLAGEKDYDRSRERFFADERVNFNALVSRVNEKLGKASRGDRYKAFSMLFNQFDWQGTSGWEYWSHDYPLVLRHALKVAEMLKLPLHVQGDVLLKLIDDAGGIAFDWEQARPVVDLHPGEDMRYVNRSIEAGKYFVLIDVQVPEHLQFNADYSQED